jgi:hypothetical protein
VCLLRGVSQLSIYTSSYLLQRLKLDPSSVNLRFVMDTVALRQGFLPVILLSLSISIHQRSTLFFLYMLLLSERQMRKKRDIRRATLRWVLLGKSDYKILMKLSFRWLMLMKGRTSNVTVAHLVEALRYKQEGYGFDSRLCHCNFSLT